MILPVSTPNTCAVAQAKITDFSQGSGERVGKRQMGGGGGSKERRGEAKCRETDKDRKWGEEEMGSFIVE